MESVCQVDAIIVWMVYMKLLSHLCMFKSGKLKLILTCSLHIQNLTDVSIQRILKRQPHNNALDHTVQPVDTCTSSRDLITLLLTTQHNCHNQVSLDCQLFLPHLLHAKKKYVRQALH